ncbi:MAG: TRAP transporter small permease [Alphaproteobacteria bacterium]|nr:TRAP transporter small permease [Alphaproteobacteria bacterium]
MSDTPPPEPATASPVPIRLARALAGAGLERALAGAAMGVIFVITFANVVVRYLTDVSFAFTEELSIFLMVVMTFLGASAAFALNRHLRMDAAVGLLGAGAKRGIEVLVMALCLTMFGLLVWYGWKLAWDDFKFDTTSPGLGVPQWWYTIWLPLLATVIMARIAERLWRIWRGGPC